MADSILREVHQCFENFRNVYEQKDYPESTLLLNKLKPMVRLFPSLPPNYQPSPTAASELTIARDIYEHAVVVDLKNEDEKAFETDFLQLKQLYYAAAGAGTLPHPPQEDMLIAIHLLRLLVKNKMEEYHDEIEMLTCVTNGLESPCIKYVVELEKGLHEIGGAYNCASLARQAKGDEDYTYANYFSDLIEVAKGREEREGSGKSDVKAFKERTKRGVPFEEVSALHLINQMVDIVKRLEPLDGEIDVGGNSERGFEYYGHLMLPD